MGAYMTNKPTRPRRPKMVINCQISSHCLHFSYFFWQQELKHSSQIETILIKHCSDYKNLKIYVIAGVVGSVVTLLLLIVIAATISERVRVRLYHNKFFAKFFLPESGLKRSTLDVRWGLLTWPNQDDQKHPCNLTKNTEDCKHYIFLTLKLTENYNCKRYEFEYDQKGLFIIEREHCKHQLTLFS